MIEGGADDRETGVVRETRRWMERGILGAVCALVIGIYVCSAQPGVLELLSQNAGDTYYNLLVRGFRAGQLSLAKEAPPGLTRLTDPYDPDANAPYRAPPYRLHDLSYYKGRLYLYFGATPALLLFWPFASLTGHYLFHADAVVIFCAIGFLISVGLLHALWRRYFAEVNVVVVAAGALALGLATGVPIMLARSDVYEVSISCAFMLTMLALGAIWRALHDPERSCRWLGAASATYGLALGARPSLLMGAIILFVPVAQAWREGRKIWAPLMAGTVPIILIGLGLMLYNALRFDSPFEFGNHYQLAGERQVTRQFFSLHFLWFNFRIFFLEPASWSVRFPFVREITTPPLPAGYGRVESPFGVLTNIPLVWLALAAPLAWRRRSAESGAILRWFVMAVALFCGVSALTICFHGAGNFRYEMEFLPVLVLLAVVGILGVARVLAAPSGLARAARWGWGLLLAFSVVFNLLAGVICRADGRYWLADLLVQGGQVDEAIRIYEGVLRVRPDFVEAHNNLGAALEQAGRVPEAEEHYEAALRLKPDYVHAYNNLGNILLNAGRASEAIGYYQQVVRLRPDSAKARYNLGVVLTQAGRKQEAIGCYEEALRLKPDYAEAHNNLGNILAGASQAADAIKHYEEALRINPDLAEAHYNLAIALEGEGKVNEAIQHCEEALRIKPDFVEAQTKLATFRAKQALRQPAR
jgi:tetratricopeptide (TPR) repeat protein